MTFYEKTNNNTSTFYVKDINGKIIGTIINIPCVYDELLEENTFDIDVAIKIEALINLIREGAIPSEIDFAELPD